VQGWLAVRWLTVSAVAVPPGVGAAAALPGTRLAQTRGCACPE